MVGVVNIPNSSVLAFQVSEQSFLVPPTLHQFSRHIRVPAEMHVFHISSIQICEKQKSVSRLCPKVLNLNFLI